MNESAHSDENETSGPTPEGTPAGQPPARQPAATQSNSPADNVSAAAANGAGSPRDRFNQEVAAKRGSLDDHEPEESLWSGGYSPRAMVGSWIIMIAVSIALIAATFFVEALTIGIALIVIAVLWTLVVANYARMRLGYHYELTSQRFIHKTGLLTRRSDRIEVIDIDDVSYEQGPIQRIFGVGTINITSSDRTDPELCLLGINKVSEVSGMIDDVRRAERRRRSLHIESI